MSSSSTEKDYEYNLPNSDYETNCAKAYLQQRSPDFNESLYDHLSELLQKILSERPKDSVAVFEEYSQQLKNERFRTETDSFRSNYISPAFYDNAKNILKYFKATEEQVATKPQGIVSNESIEQLQDLPKMFYNFQQASVNLPQSEILLLDFSIRALLKKVPIENILEQREQFNMKPTESDEETSSTNNDESDAKKTTQMIIPSNSDIEINQMKEKNIKFAYHENQRINEIPVERLGSGANGNVYLVCNYPGLDEWIELPPVTPQQIIISRQIAHYFTGKLDTEINTYPTFPGKEKNYLRAQIARISATTLISPVGYFVNYSSDEGENEEMYEDETDDDDKDIILEENENYNPPSLKELLDPSMTSWCHYSPYLQKQGRVIFWAPDRNYDKDADDNEMFRKEDNDAVKSRTWSRLLTPLSEDASTDGVLPWCTRHFSKSRPETSIVLVRSNIWPGAFAYAAEKHFGNIYIGWGYKFSVCHYVPLEPKIIKDISEEEIDYEAEGNEDYEDIDAIANFSFI